MKLRIQKYKKGYVVEVQKKVLFTKYWAHFISVTGMSDEPWYYSTYDYAMDNLLKKIKWDTLSNSESCK